MDLDYTGLRRLVGASIRWVVSLGWGKAKTAFRRVAFSLRKEALAAIKCQLLLVGVLLLLQPPL